MALDIDGDDVDDGDDGEEEVNGHWPLARAASQQSDDGGSRHCDQGLVMRTGFGCSTLTMHGDENHDCETDAEDRPSNQTQLKSIIAWLNLNIKTH